MNMNNTLTYEEQQLMALYNSEGTRAALIAELTEVRGYLDSEDSDILELIDSTLTKLKAMTDADFGALALFPDYLTEDDTYAG